MHDIAVEIDVLILKDDAIIAWFILVICFCALEVKFVSFSGSALGSLPAGRTHSPETERTVALTLP